MIRLKQNLGTKIKHFNNVEDLKNIALVIGLKGISTVFKHSKAH